MFHPLPLPHTPSSSPSQDGAESEYYKSASERLFSLLLRSRRLTIPQEYCLRSASTKSCENFSLEVRAVRLSRTELILFPFGSEEEVKEEVDVEDEVDKVKYLWRETICSTLFLFPTPLLLLQVEVEEEVKEEVDVEDEIKAKQNRVFASVTSKMRRAHFPNERNKMSE